MTRQVDPARPDCNPLTFVFFFKKRHRFDFFKKIESIRTTRSKPGTQALNRIGFKNYGYYNLKHYLSRICYPNTPLFSYIFVFFKVISQGCLFKRESRQILIKDCMLEKANLATTKEQILQIFKKLTMCSTTMQNITLKQFQ